jgi:hypothetical protein
MSLEDLDAYVWASLSPRKYAAGRAFASRIARRVVRKWPQIQMSQATPADHPKIMGEIAHSIDRSERQNFQMGILLTLVLTALIQEIVKAVLRWWLKSASNRVALVGWQSEMRK